MKKNIHFASLVAHTRAWFGLTQAQLALYLGISPALAQHLESGQRALTPGVLAALLPLVQQLPAPAESSVPGPPAEPPVPAPPLAGLPPGLPLPEIPPGLPAPDLAELAFRRRECLVRAARLEAELATLGQRALVAQRWAQALPALLAAAETTAATELAAAGPDAHALAAATNRATWRTGWLHRRAQPLPPATATRWHLLRAQAAALAAQAAALGTSAGGPAGA